MQRKCILSGPDKVRRIVLRGGLGSQTSRGKNIEVALLTMHGSVASEASGACNPGGHSTFFQVGV